MATLNYFNNFEQLIELLRFIRFNGLYVIWFDLIFLKTTLTIWIVLFFLKMKVKKNIFCNWKANFKYSQRWYLFFWLILKANTIKIFKFSQWYLFNKRDKNYKVVNRSCPQMYHDLKQGGSLYAILHAKTHEI